MLQHLFVLDISVLEKIVRPIVVYFFLLLLLRIFGKRELAQLNPFDLVVLLALSNTVQNAIIGSDNSLLGGIIGAATLLGINFLTVRFLWHHQKIETLIEGCPTILVESGKICEEGLKSELLTKDELMIVIRRQGFYALDEIDACVLEPNGTFSITPKEPLVSQLQHQELIAELRQLKLEINKLQNVVKST